MELVLGKLYVKFYCELGFIIDICICNFMIGVIKNLLCCIVFLVCWCCYFFIFVLIYIVYS